MRLRVLLVLLIILSYNAIVFAESPIRQGVLVTTYNRNSTLCDQFYSLYSSFEECSLTDGYCLRFKLRSKDDSVAIQKIPIEELAVNQYGYTQIDVAYPVEKPYAIVYLDRFKGDHNPRLQETWKVNVKELQALTERDPHPLPLKKWALGEHQIKQETYASEFTELLAHGEKVSNDWSPVFAVDGVDYVVIVECAENLVYGGFYNCNRIIKVTVKRIASDRKATPICEFSKSKRK